jgi:hypothetical protein
VLDEVREGGRKFILLSKCDTETASEIQQIGEQAKDADNNTELVSEIKDDYAKAVKNQVYGARLNALAIVMAHISLAMKPIQPEHRVKSIFVKIVQGKTVFVYYDPEDDIYDIVQTLMPRYVNRILGSSLPITRGSRFNNPFYKDAIKEGTFVAVLA